MLLNNEQKSGLSIVEQAFGDQPIAPDSPDVQRSRLTAQRIAPAQAVVEKTVGDSLKGGIFTELPNFATPELIDHLKTLSAFNKAGKNATAEQQAQAVEAYKGLGRGIKIVLAKELIRRGIKAKLETIDQVAPFASMIANVTSGPIAEFAVDHIEKQQALVMKVINKGLEAIGREPISTENQDLFMTKLVSKFSDDILNQMGAKQRLNTSQMVMAKEIPGMGPEEYDSRHQYESLMKYLKASYGFKVPPAGSKDVNDVFGPKHDDFWSADNAALNVAQYLSEPARRLDLSTNETLKATDFAFNLARVAKEQGIAEYDRVVQAYVKAATSPEAEREKNMGEFKMASFTKTDGTEMMGVGLFAHTLQKIRLRDRDGPPAPEVRAVQRLEEARQPVVSQGAAV